MRQVFKCASENINKLLIKWYGMSLVYQTSEFDNVYIKKCVLVYTLILILADEI